MFLCLALMTGQAWGQEILLFEQFYPQSQGGGVSFRVQYYEGTSGPVQHGFERSWFNNGDLSGETYYSHGEKEGLSRAWNQGGGLIFSGNYIDGLEEGNLTRWHADNTSQIESVIPYVLGQRHGTEQHWNTSGVLILEAGWSNGLKQGLTKERFSDGSLETSGAWDQGKKQGVHKKWKFGGILLWSETWDRDQLTKRVQYYDNGDIFTEKRWLDELKTGTWSTYSMRTADGQTTTVLTLEQEWNEDILQIERDIQYLHSDECGIPERRVFEDVYLDGGIDHQNIYIHVCDVLRERYIEVAGLRHGKYELWWPDGTRRAEHEYIGGSIQGDAKTWHENGQLHETFEYKDNLKHGDSKTWLEDGYLFKEETFRLGKLHGPAAKISYPGFGTDIEISDYRHGRLHGFVVMIGNYIGGYASSATYTLEARNGGPVSTAVTVVRKTIPYQNGKKNGVEVGNYDHGVAYEITWVNDERVGPYAYYAGRTTSVTGQVSGRTHTVPKGFRVNSGTNPCGPRSHWVVQLNLPPQSDKEFYRNSPKDPDCDEEIPSALPPVPLIPEQSSMLTKIHGTLLDESGVVMEGVAIEIVADETNMLMTDAKGEYAVTIALTAEAREISIRASKAGYETWLNEKVRIDKGQSLKTLDIRLTPLGHNGPIIQRFGPTFIGDRPSFGGIFLETPTATVDFGAVVDWRDSTPGELRYRNNGSLATVSGFDVAIKSYAVPGDFVVSRDPTRNQLSVQAVDDTGNASNTEIIHPVVLPVPDWAESILIAPISLSSGNVTGKETYILKMAMPEEKTSFQLAEDQVPGLVWDLWSAVPIVGGFKFGLPPTQLASEAMLSSTGEGTFKGDIAVGFEAAGLMLAGHGAAAGKALYKPYEGWTLVEVTAELSVDNSFDRPVSLLSVLPKIVEKTEKVPVLRTLVKRLRKLTELKITTMVAGGGKA